MSLLAHAIYAAPRFEAQKRALDARIRHETLEAKRIQAVHGTTWAEAIRLACSKPLPTT